MKYVNFHLSFKSLRIGKMFWFKMFIGVVIQHWNTEHCNVSTTLWFLFFLLSEKTAVTSNFEHLVYSLVH